MKGKHMCSKGKRDNKGWKVCGKSADSTNIYTINTYNEKERKSKSKEHGIASGPE